MFYPRRKGKKVNMLRMCSVKMEAYVQSCDALGWATGRTSRL